MSCCRCREEASAAPPSAASAGSGRNSRSGSLPLPSLPTLPSPREMKDMANEAAAKLKAAGSAAAKFIPGLKQGDSREPRAELLGQAPGAPGAGASGGSGGSSVGRPPAFKERGAAHMRSTSEIKRAYGRPAGSASRANDVRGIMDQNRQMLQVRSGGPMGRPCQCTPAMGSAGSLSRAAQMALAPFIKQPWDLLGVCLSAGARREAAGPPAAHRGHAERRLRVCRPGAAAGGALRQQEVVAVLTRAVALAL